MLNDTPQQPISGISFAYAFDDPQAPSRRTRKLFEMSQNLSIYDEGWVAATAPMVTPWEKSPPPPVPLAERRWQLYNLETDFSEAHDLAARHPDKLAALQKLYWEGAAKANILPIHSSDGGQVGRPDLNAGRNEFTYVRPVSNIPESAAPHLVGRSFAIEASIEVPETGSRGVLVSHGGRFGGYSLFLDGEGRPAFTYNLTPAHVTRIRAKSPLAPGAHEIRVEFRLTREEAGAGAEAILFVDGAEQARQKVERSFILVVSHTEGFNVGSDPISPVDRGYESRTSGFTGKLNRVTVRLGGG